MDNKYKCPRCSSNQISINDNDISVCFSCKHKFLVFRHQVGDKVRVRADLSSRKNMGVVDDMERFRGKILTIEMVESRGYTVKETHWIWRDTMFDDEFTNP